MFFVLGISVSFQGAARAGVQEPYLNDGAQLSYGVFLLSDGDLRGAAREFQRLIEEFPASPLLPKAQFNMAEALFKAGHIRDAERNFRFFISNFGAREPLLQARAVERVNEAMRIRPPIKAFEGRRKAGLPVVMLEPEPALPPSTESLRAVQVMLFGGKGIEDVSGEMRRLKQAGVNTVIFRVFHNEGDRFHRGVAPPADKRSGVYFNTLRAPVVADILSGVAEAAHRNGLKIFAWMTTRYADYGIEGREELQCKGYDIGMGGGGLTRCKGLDLFNDAAARRIDGIYSDLAEYEIDGVLFQDDLVLRHNEGFGKYAAALFRKETGEGLRPEAMYLRSADTDAVQYTPLFWKWAAWKNRRLLHVANTARAAVKKKRPEAKFAINLMYESVSNPANSLAWLSQSLGAAVKEGFDYYSIMAYHRQMASELSKNPAEVKALIEKIAADASRTAGDAGKVLIKFQTVDWETGQPLSNGEVAELIRAVKGLKGISLAVVPYRRDFPFYELGESGGPARARFKRGAGAVARLD